MAVDDSYTVALLHCDGTDHSTNFIEESGKSVTVEGSTEISTAQKVFGSGSMLLPGAGDVYMAQSTDWDFLAGDFTIDFRYRPSDQTPTRYVMFRSQPDPFAGTGFRINAPGGKMDFWHYVDPNYESFHSTTNAVSFTNGTWYHVALVKYGSVGTFYVDGVAQAMTVTVPFPANPTVISGPMYIGCWSMGTPGYFLNGNLDEIRISKGIARWTSNFTPPTEEYTPSITTKRHQIITC